jgi:molecular chaperone HtpG
MTEMTTHETHEFKAEINQLMNLIINSLYSDKDIFLRELISNASDAIDKLRYILLNDGGSMDTLFAINIVPNKETKQLMIVDNGLGMTKEDMINNLGMIAKSGTKEFVKKIEKAKIDASLIGQFGVGFYSAYLVADNVSVYSKSHNDNTLCHLWQSNINDGGTFTIDTVDNIPFLGNSRGTVIVLDIRDDCQDYLNNNTLKDIIKKHSQFISYDLFLQVEKERDVNISERYKQSESLCEINSDVNVDDVNVEDVDDDTDNNDNCKDTKEFVEKEKYLELEKQNAVPIWSRSKNDVSIEEYKEFYKSLNKSGYGDYMDVIHFTTEGNIDLQSILFVSVNDSFDMFDRHDKMNNIKLYVRKVFITDDCENYCPKWLSFIKGVVDSKDLPLNVSREILQKNSCLKAIKKIVTKKSIDMITKLSDDVEKYEKFYNSYGKYIKLGVHEDSTNSDRLIKLLRFKTSNNSSLQSLDSYCSNMKDNQDSIYYLCGEDISLDNSPFIEKCKSLGYEVLFMNEPIDEYMMQKLRDYKYNDKTHKFASLTKEGFKLDDDDNTDNFNDLCSVLKKIINDQKVVTLEKVVVSKRLESSPCILVSSEYGYSAYMEKIVKLQAMGNGVNNYMQAKKIFEINPKNKIIQYLNDNKDKKTDTKYINTVLLLVESASLLSGFDLNDRASFVDKINDIIMMNCELNLSHTELSTTLQSKLLPEPFLDNTSDNSTLSVNNDQMTDIDESE